MPLNQKFYSRKTQLVAQGLLGKVLVRKFGGKILSGIITETEAYVGPHDLACHAAKGRTKRTETMFSPAGRWYVYLIYGRYHCLNIVTEEKDYPSAVLIRSIVLIEGMKQAIRNRGLNSRSKNLQLKAYRLRLTNGPGKLCQALGINRKFNGTSATARNAKLFIEDRGIKIPQSNIVKSKRVGVDYAKEWKDKLLRFSLVFNS